MFELTKIDYIIILAALFLLILIFIKISSENTIIKRPANFNMPFGKLIYADQKSKKKKEAAFGRVLYSEKYNLRGRPDYIFRNSINGRIIPVEIKSGDIKGKDYPHEGDIMQLAAYFLIIEDIYGKKPKYGILMYKNCSFKIRNTVFIRKKVRNMISRMKKMLETGNENTSPDFAKCRPCILRGTICEKCIEKAL
ncbi:MAG: Dna2/Cas4 domain-containing protein [Lachnospiraceae bacterium]|nr:Dna2/Cas4 domain-containing protein [Lachnospiraceae bacterium]